MQIKFSKPGGIVLISLALLLAGSQCRKEPQPASADTIADDTEEELAAPRTFVQQNAQGDYQYLTTGNTPKVPLNANEELLQIIDLNLDLDQDDEQILILKLTDDINTPIKIAVIDFDPVREKEIRSWEYLTNSTNQRAFNLEFEDIIGDFNLELIFTGTNKNGETTFYAFQKAPSPSNLGLFFSPICQLVSDGSISIERSTRSASYQLRQITGKSFPIIVERRDPESENTLDLVQETYDWNYTNNQYELVASKRLPGSIVEENRLKALYYSNDLADFEAFLEGPWYNKKAIETMIVFSPEQHRLVFFAEDIQEEYDWDYMKKTVYNSLMFIVKNPASDAFRKKLTITIKALDTIDVTIGDINWDGTYMKVNEELRESLLKKHSAPVEPAHLSLTGYYEDENEELKIIFEPPRFTRIDSTGTVTEGGFTVTENIPVLNSFFLNRKLWKVPRQFTKQEFEKEILAEVPTYTAQNTLKSYYAYDKATQSYRLDSTELTQEDEAAIWEILLSINYKGYTDYQVCVLSLNVLDENTLTSSVSNYIMEYAEVQDEEKTTRSLVLTEGDLSVKGIEALSDTSILLVQTEYLD